MAYQFVSEDACPKTPLRKPSQVTDYKTQKIYHSNAHKELFLGGSSSLSKNSTCPSTTPHVTFRHVSTPTAFGPTLRPPLPRPFVSFRRRPQFRANFCPGNSPKNSHTHSGTAQADPGRFVRKGTHGGRGDCLNLGQVLAQGKNLTLRTSAFACHVLPQHAIRSQDAKRYHVATYGFSFGHAGDCNRSTVASRKLLVPRTTIVMLRLRFSDYLRQLRGNFREFLFA